MKITLNKLTLNIEDSKNESPFQKIEDFRLETFYKKKKSTKPTKKIPRTEVQFKYGKSYFLAYYSDYEDKYIIRKFN